MSKPVNKLGYNLSPSKIIKNLDSSRQKWRQKALTRNQVIRQQQWQIRDLKKSRDAWRDRALHSPPFIEEVLMPIAPASEQPDMHLPPAIYLKDHPYALWQMECSIKMYLFSSMGYRTIAQTWLIQSQYLELRTPSFSVIRHWVLRLGHYRLHQPVERADDWVYIIDYTLQMGLEQCLVILGVRLDELRSEDHWQLSAQDVRVLDVSLTHWPNSAHIKERLELVVAQTGSPRQIVADGARAIRNGIELLAEDLEENLLYTYDLSHLVALRLKKLLSGSEQWQQLVKALNQVQKASVQTIASFLAPPSLRKTARYMNLSKVVEWTANLLTYKEEGNFDLLAKNWSFNEDEFPEDFETVLQLLELKAESPEELLEHLCPRANPDKAPAQVPMRHDGQAQFQKRFAAIIAMRPFLLQVRQLMELVKCLLLDFKRHSLSKARWEAWQQFPGELLEPLARNFWKQCQEDLNPYIEALPDNKNWLATSDIIESIFGRYKAKGEKYWLKGITPNILFIPALVGKFDDHIVQNALANTTYQDVLRWFSNQRKGDSFLAKRRKALSPPAKRLKMVGTFFPSIFYCSTA